MDFNTVVQEIAYFPETKRIVIDYPEIRPLPDAEIWFESIYNQQ